MKKVFLSTLALASFITFGVSHNTFAAKSKTEIEKEKIVSQIQYYDADGKKIYPYSEAELKQMLVSKAIPNPLERNMSLASVGLYSANKTKKIGKTTFAYNVWIGGGSYGAAYKNPIDLRITPVGTSRAINILVYKNKDGKAGAKAGQVKMPSGWQGEVHMSWQHLKRGKKYRIQMVNVNGSSTKKYKLKSGVLTYGG